MSTSSTGTFTTTTTSAVQEEGASIFPLGAGYTAPPPTPLTSLPATHPPHDFILCPPLLQNKSAANAENFFPSATSNSIASPPTKEDLDALAQYLMQQSLHSTPNLLASPTLRRKRRTIAAESDNENMDSTSVEKEVHVVNGRNDIFNFGEVVQTYSYASGFCEESRRGIGKACQEVGAFYIAVQDADTALTMLRERHGTDGESIAEGGLVPLSQLLTSTSQHHQNDDLDLEPLAFDSIVNTTFRDIVTRFAKLSLRISKDLLRFLLEDLSNENQAIIRGHSLKPLLYIHGNGKQDLNLDDDVVLFMSHDIDTHDSDNDDGTLFLAGLGTQLQAWSQGKYKASLLKSPCSNGSGGVCLQFALIQHH